MLFQPSNVSPSSLSGAGAGTVDVTNPLQVSWQVNGDSPMTAYQIVIYQNTTESTQMYSSGEVALAEPFQAHDAMGNPQFFATEISASAIASAGIVNGYEYGYKMLITQWWSDTESVAQTSASVFITRDTPTLEIGGTSADPEDPAKMTITANYEQTQGDPVSWVSWVFALSGKEDDPIAESGPITTQILSYTVEGLMSGVTYAIKCTVQTSNGVQVTTGFVDFSADYEVETAPAEGYVLGRLNGHSAVYLQWPKETFTTNIYKYIVYRQNAGDAVLRKIAEVEAETNRICDYSAASQKSVSYVIWTLGAGGEILKVVQTGSFTPVFWEHTILLTSLNADGTYRVTNEYSFSLGVESGAVTNSNSPTLQENFTRFPNRQPKSSLYKTGSVKAYIGKASGLNQYQGDTVAYQDDIYEISASNAPKFYKNRKGDVLLVDTSAAITMQTQDDTYEQALVATISWAEIGSAKNKSIVSLPTDSFWPGAE